MNKHLPYNILLALAIVVSCFTVAYNLNGREYFAVQVRYELSAGSEDLLLIPDPPLELASPRIVGGEPEEDNTPAPEAPVDIQEQEEVPGTVSEESPMEDSGQEQEAADPADDDDGDRWDDDDEDDEDYEVGVRFPLNINTATVEQLKLIPRVGDVTAQRIVQYREVLGGYSDLEQLKEIKGIGDATYANLEPYLYVPGDEWDMARRAS